MGQYKYSIYVNWQFGLLLSADEYQITLTIGMFSFIYGVPKYAKGFEFCNNLW